MFERLTDRARRVMELAEQEARRFNHEYIGTEHILLGLVEEAGGRGANVLKTSGVDLNKVRLEVEKLVKSGPDPVAKGKLPSTPRAKEVVKHALKEAKRLHHNYIGTEHLLVALLLEGEGVAAQVLMNLGIELENVRREVSRLLAVQQTSGTTEDQELSGPAPANSQTLEYVQRLLKDAAKARASDIHLDPTEDGQGIIRMRTDGVLHKVDPPPQGLFSQVVNHIKTMAALNVEDRRLPQDGRIMMDIEAKRFDIRVSCAPVHYGQRIVMRLLFRECAILGLDEMGILAEDLVKIRRLCHLNNGLVICNGPAGCGKTTLLYSMLNEIDREKECVMTIEDPVEYSFDGIGQIGINPQIGLTYARAMRTVLRQDPDVIMVGEIRDLEVAHLCTHAALTGHLIMTIFHASSSPGAIKQLLEMGLEPFLINSILAAVISQKLVRRLCSECKQPAKLPPSHSIPAEAAEFLADHPTGKLFGPKGCHKCLNTGYSGRTTTHEILILDDKLRQLITDSADTATLRQAAIDNGMKTLLTNGLEKAAQGITSVEEVLRVTTGGVNI